MVNAWLRPDIEGLPAEVVHEAKRSLLDALGCGIAGLATDKGRIAAVTAKRLAGPGESSILGLGDRVSCANAALADGELINGLDYDAIPHIQPFVILPALAIAESIGATGKELIVSTAIAQEVAEKTQHGPEQHGREAHFP